MTIVTVNGLTYAAPIPTSPCDVPVWSGPDPDHLTWAGSVAWTGDGYALSSADWAADVSAVAALNTA